MKESILILGAGFMQTPAVNAAKQMGYKTVVVDANPNAVLVPYADIFEPIDLKDRESLLGFAQKLEKSGEKIAAVFTAGTDFSSSVAYVAKKMNLPGHSFEAALNASDKIRMRQCFSSSSVPSPSFQEVCTSDLQDIFSKIREKSFVFPKVLKPVDNMGGRGCRLVREEKELKSALETAVKNSRTKRAVLEDYMDGKEYSIDSVIYNGTLTITGFADRHIYFPPYFIEMGHTIPSCEDEKIKGELIATFAAGIKALGLTQGVAKADIKYTKNGPMIGEIAARLSGGYMSGWTFPYSSGCFLTQEALKVSLGFEPDYLVKNRVPVKWQCHPSLKDKNPPFEIFELPSKYVSAERAWISIPGKIKEIKGLKQAEQSEFVMNVIPRCKEGDTVDFPRNNVEKCGNIITKAPTRLQAVESAEKALSQITVFLESNNEKTSNFLWGQGLAEESGFPPQAFNINLKNENFPDIQENESVMKNLPESLKNHLNEKDWNSCSLEKVLQNFDKFCPEHKKLNGKKFWQALVKGSLQGVLYAAEN